MSNGHETDERQAFDGSLAGLSLDDAIKAISRHVPGLETENQTDWILELADIVDRNGLPVQVLRRCSNSLSWRARRLGMPLPDDTLRLPDGLSSTRTSRLALAYGRATRLQLDFKFDQLLSWTRSVRSEFPTDAMVRALAAFAALGNGAPQAASLLAAAVAADGYDKSCRFLCLQGLWMASDLPQADRLAVELADEIIGLGEDEAGVHYWRAGALRRLGRLDEALQSVDVAIDLLGPGSNSVHQDYVRERELIGATKALDERIDEIVARALTDLRAAVAGELHAAQQEIEEQHSQARRIVSESLVGIIEVLAIFVTLAGFLVGSGAVLAQADGFWQNLAGIALILAGCITLFVLLRVIVHPRPGTPRTESALARLWTRARRR
jgi:tetratricopeptide (TPR) repeat protein